MGMTYQMVPTWPRRRQPSVAGAEAMDQQDMGLVVQQRKLEAKDPAYANGWLQRPVVRRTILLGE